MMCRVAWWTTRFVPSMPLGRACCLCFVWRIGLVARRPALSENSSAIGFPADFVHPSEKGWMWRKNWPSYNLAMREARLAFAYLGTCLLLAACGPNEPPNDAGGGGGGAAGAATG